MTFLRRREKRSHVYSTAQISTIRGKNEESANIKVPRIHKFRRLITILLGSILVVALLVYLILPPPEIFLFDTYSPQQLAENLPPQCLDVAARFHQCQLSQNYTRVFACHRRWCTSTGHCEPCSGIGDRTHHLMQKVQEAVDNCVRVEIDYPQADMAQLITTVYRDKGSWLAELFRYRSYDVSHRTYHRAPPPSSSSLRPAPRVTYSHFFEKGQFHEGPWNSFDPCLYHILFQPNIHLKQELQRHNALIGISSPSIGIHFRTGDKHMKIHRAANKKDDRIQGHVGDAFEKMLDCAHQLAKQLFPREQRQSVKYFLATDNLEVKDIARTKYPHLVYTTNVIPDTFLGGVSADRNALLELLLLSQRNGLVANVNPENNKISERLSTFHQLAQKIGFIDPNSQVVECELD